MINVGIDRQFETSSSNIFRNVLRGFKLNFYLSNKFSYDLYYCEYEFTHKNSDKFK
jgi:hypothetical protein